MTLAPVLSLNTLNIFLIKLEYPPEQPLFLIFFIKIVVEVKNVRLYLLVQILRLFLVSIGRVCEDPLYLFPLSFQLFRHFYL